MSFLSTGIAWISPVTVRDWLRTNSDNDGIIAEILKGLPEEIQIRTGVSAELVRSEECPEIVRQLTLFLLAQRFDPEAAYVDRVVDSLEKACQFVGE